MGFYECHQAYCFSQYVLDLMAVERALTIVQWNLYWMLMVHHQCGICPGHKPWLGMVYTSHKWHWMDPTGFYMGHELVDPATVLMAGCPLHAQEVALLSALRDTKHQSKCCCIEKKNTVAGKLTSQRRQSWGYFTHSIVGYTAFIANFSCIQWSNPHGWSFLMVGSVNRRESS